MTEPKLTEGGPFTLNFGGKMIEQELFNILKDATGICRRVCPYWDKQGQFCFASDPKECTKLNNIRAAGWISPRMGKLRDDIAR